MTRMVCRCIVVSDGSEAVGVANGDIRFDVIMLDLNMPISTCPNMRRALDSPPILSRWRSGCPVYSKYEQQKHAHADCLCQCLYGNRHACPRRFVFRVSV